VFRQTVNRRGLKRDLLIRRAGVCARARAVEEQASRCVAENAPSHYHTSAEQITPICTQVSAVDTPAPYRLQFLIADDTRTALTNLRMSRDVSQHRTVGFGVETLHVAYTVMCVCCHRISLS